MRLYPGGKKKIDRFLNQAEGGNKKDGGSVLSDFFKGKNLGVGGISIRNAFYRPVWMHSQIQTRNEATEIT